MITLHLTLILNIIIIIEYINDEWLVKHVWNYEQLMKNKSEIQMSLLLHLLHDRNHEIVSKLVNNIVFISYCVNCFRRHSG